MRTHLLAALTLALSLPLSEAAPTERAVTLRSGIARAEEATDLAAGGPVVVQLSKPLTPEDRAAAVRAGLRLSAPLGADSFLGWLSAGRVEHARTLSGVAWIAPLAPRLKLAPEIATVVEDDARAVIPVTIHLFAHASIEELRARVEHLGIPVLGASAGRLAEGSLGERAARLVITPTSTQLVAIRDEIALWPETQWVGARPIYRLLNDTSIWVTQSGLAAGQTTPIFAHGLLGEGQVVGILDTGLDADMCYFRDPVLGLPPTTVGFGTGSPSPFQRKVRIVDFLAPGESPANNLQWDTQGHGTHCAGIVAGDNFASPGAHDAADGMAPLAKLVIQDGGYAVDNCADLPAIGCPAADLIPFFTQAYAQGARIHSNSWGDRENLTPFNIYSDGSQDADEFMWTHPDFLLVFAAGNNGGTSATVASPATGKNVLSVGATNHDFSAGTVASFSSKGPTADGRVKPDLMAPGSAVNSASSNGSVSSQNCGIVALSGTSMACPTAAGLAALAREYYEKGFYPSGEATPGDTRIASAALLRATLIASAFPMEGVAAKPPSNEQGWGRILLDDALEFAGDRKRLFVEDLASRFASPSDPADAYTLTVLDPTEPLRVVLAWTDYPSTPAASVNLVNDLDLTVEAPGGAVVYRGNVFSNGMSQTGGSADRRNNVEVVRIEAPTPGAWTIRVTPFAVPQPAQGYALVVTGRLPEAGVFLERTALGVDDTVGGNGNGIAEPGEWIDLSLTLANNGDQTATSVVATVASLSPEVEVIQDASELQDLATGTQGSTEAPLLRIHVKTSAACGSTLTLRFTYSADGASRQEDVQLPIGSQAVFLNEDFEDVTSWAHVAGESNATTGAWVVGDPVGTGFQPENDRTIAPGVRCLYTAPNPTGSAATDDVDNGVVVARSGSYDLTGHPEARVRISRWFGNRDLGRDAQDFFRLAIREGGASPDVTLEDLGTNVTSATWTDVTFRVADFVTPGPTIQLKASASDGVASGNVIETAIDEIAFWDPACSIYEPPPNAVFPLLASRSGADVVLSWTPPAVDPLHGEAVVYRIYRSDLVTSGFALIDSTSDLTRTDPGAATDPAPFHAYLVLSENNSGTATETPP